MEQYDLSKFIEIKQKKKPKPLVTELNFESLINNITLGDFFDYANLIPNETIDLIFVDPPYNIASDSKITLGKRSKINKKKCRIESTNKAWGKDFNDQFSNDKFYQFMTKLAKIYNRIAKKGASILIFYDYYCQFKLFPFYQRFGKPQQIITLIKENPLWHVRKNNYRPSFECCAWFVKGAKPNTFNFLGQKDMKNIFEGRIGAIAENKKETSHPNEKYLWEIEPLILINSKVDDLILDSFSGSGTISKVAKKFKRRFIGVEINPRFWEESVKRIEKTSIDNSQKYVNGRIENFNLKTPPSKPALYNFPSLNTTKKII